MQSKIIGIIGGMGPYAGLDVNKKIYENTIAESDKEHLNVVCLSLSQGIPDRSKFLLGETSINPAIILAKKISNYPMDVVGIACNTFHSPKIFDVLQSELLSQNRVIQLLHLPEEVLKVAEEKFYNGTLGVLCTLGTYETQIYQNTFKNSSVKLKFPNKDGREAIHRAIYNTTWGIKQKGYLSPAANQLISTEIDQFIDLEVDAILLACTELPLVVNEINFRTSEVIDTNLVLAKALIAAVAPNKLKGYPSNVVNN